MQLKDISNYRLLSQQLLTMDFSTSDNLLDYMGAMQAQDLQMSLLAIALRLEKPSLETAENALIDGKILRTHLMRPTWHLVSAANIHWMLDLTAASLKRLSTPRNRQLELSDEILNASYRILEKELQGRELSREKIAEILRTNKIKTDENRLAHILGMAEYEKIVTSATVNGNKQNYALLAERVPEHTSFSREESVLMLTERYFKSHAPATIADFAWWSFLPLKEIRAALEELKDKFVTVKVNDEVYYFPPKLLEKPIKKSGIHFLPAFDEFLVSYKSKHICVADEHRIKAATLNGIFKPIVVQNGQIIGTWKKSGSKKNPEIITDYFTKEINSEKEKKKLLNILN